MQIKTTDFHTTRGLTLKQYVIFFLSSFSITILAIFLIENPMAMKGLIAWVLSPIASVLGNPNLALQTFDEIQSIPVGFLGSFLAKAGMVIFMVKAIFKINSYRKNGQKFEFRFAIGALPILYFFFHYTGIDWIMWLSEQILTFGQGFDIGSVADLATDQPFSLSKAGIYTFIFIAIYLGLALSQRILNIADRWPQSQKSAIKA